MSEEREPIRLRDDPSEAAGLRAMLDAASGEVVRDAMLDRVLAGVLAGGGGGGASGGGATAGKIAAALGASVIGAGVIALIATSAIQPSALEPPPRSIVIASDAAVAPDAFLPLDAGPADVGIDGFVVARIERHGLPRPTVTEMESDGALLMRMTREHDPALSLALARDHRARFPNSPGSEDREARIVLDLAALERATEASTSADAFRARWPHSAHLPHIEAALARMRAP